MAKRKRKQPIQQQQLRELSGQEEILTFHFQMLCLWELDAASFLHEHLVSMYALLPTMRGANADVLAQALQEMAEHYQGQETELANQLKWLGVLLRRARIMPAQDQQEIQERLDMWDNLLEQDEYLQKKIVKAAEKRAEKAAELLAEKLAEKIVEKEIAERLAEAEKRLAEEEAKARAEGEVQASQKMLLDLIEVRFPQLAELAQQRVKPIKETIILRQFMKQIAVASDESTARWIIGTYAA